MKIGMRKPSLTRSLKARTTSKWKRQAKKAIIPGYGKKGMGWVKNPKKAMYNKVYHKTTFGFSDLFKLSKKRAKNNEQPLQYDSSRQHTSNKNKRGSFIFLIVSLILLFILPPLGVLLLLVNFFVFIIKYFSSKKRKVTSSNPSVDKIIFHEDFLLMGTNYHKEEAEIAADFLSEGVHYFGKDNKYLKSYILRTYKTVYKYNKLKTVDVILQREPLNKHDKNAIKVLVNNTFVGYIPAEIARKIAFMIQNKKYRYDAILTGRGGPYKTVDLDTEKIIERKKELSYYLDLTIWKIAK